MRSLLLAVVPVMRNLLLAVVLQIILRHIVVRSLIVTVRWNPLIVTVTHAERCEANDTGTRLCRH